jgi:PAS domain S-box-containing protein
MSQGPLMFDASERIVVCNRRYIEMYGLSPDVVKPGLSFRDLILHRKERGSFSGDVDQYCRDRRDAFANKMTSLTVQTGDGRSIRIINQLMANGGWVATHEDITERQKAQMELERTRAFLDTVIENVPVTVFVKEAREQRYVLVNRAAEQLWGISRNEVIGKNAYDLFPERTAEVIVARDVELLEHAGQVFHTTHQVETPNNGTRLVESRRIAVLDDNGKPEYLLGVIEDVTERARADERIKFMAHHDLLTGLSNRALFMEKIEEAGARLRRRGETFTVFMLDLDRFKNVNDSLGHPEGDTLLKETARRLKCSLRETDVLARLGGDESRSCRRARSTSGKARTRWPTRSSTSSESRTRSTAARSPSGPASGSRSLRPMASSPAS